VSTVTTHVLDTSLGRPAAGARSGQRTFYPEAAVTFLVEETGGNYHVPLVLSPFAYSTYRGS
jgi:5-hydroxyisourate hydrolase-like protein (transthyretin family)